MRRTGELPPRVHNLLRLAEVAAIELDQERGRFLAQLSGFYVQSRYPEEMRASGSTVTQEPAYEVLAKTKETVKWVLSIL